MSRTKKVSDNRKVRYTDKQIKELILALEEYLDITEFPKIAHFVIQPVIRHKYKLTQTYMYDHPEYFGYLLDMMTAKAEDYLTTLAIRRSSTPALFLLKQPKFGGYSDKQDIDLKASSQPIKFINAVPRPKKKTS